MELFAGMDVFGGVVQCWPLDKQCVVNWGAWSAVIAAVALIVAYWTVVVTGISAVAVFWLGQQANRLAMAGHDAVRDEREREARFILAYLYPEITNAYSNVAAWLDIKGDLFFTHWLELSASDRSLFLADACDTTLPLAMSHFGRLHVLEHSVGAALARALSTSELLKLAKPYVLDMQAGERDADARLNATLMHLRNLARDLQVVQAAGQRVRAAI